MEAGVGITGLEREAKEKLCKEHWALYSSLRARSSELLMDRIFLQRPRDGDLDWRISLERIFEDVGLRIKRIFNAGGDGVTQDMNNNNNSQIVQDDDDDDDRRKGQLAELMAELRLKLEMQGTHLVIRALEQVHLEDEETLQTYIKFRTFWDVELKQFMAELLDWLYNAIVMMSADQLDKERREFAIGEVMDIGFELLEQILA